VKRANTFAVRPLTDDDEQVLRDLLDACAALWNQVNYHRLMRYKDDGRVLKGVVRKDAYTVEWGDRSRIDTVVRD
jgi:hypothetical protein